MHLPPEPWKNIEAVAHKERKDDPQMMFNISIDGSSLSENLDEFDSIRSVLLYRLVNPETTLSTNLNAAHLSIYLRMLQTQHVVRSLIVSEYHGGFENLQGGRNNDTINTHACIFKLRHSIPIYYKYSSGAYFFLQKSKLDAFSSRATPQTKILRKLRRCQRQR